MRRSVLLLILLAQLAIGLYGIAQPIRWGHEGFHVAEHGLAARNLVRHGSWAVTRHHGPSVPPAATLNFHHPFLLHPYVAVAHEALGEEPWVARTIPLFFGLLALAGLWTLAARVRSEAEAALACALFVLTPLNVCYSHLPDHQIIAVAYTLWSFVGLVDWLRGGRLASAALWLGAGVLAGLTDWPWYPVAFLVFAGLATQLWRRRLATAGGPSRRQLMAGVAAFAVLVAASFAHHFAWAWAAGGWEDLMVAARDRGPGSSTSEFVGIVLWRIHHLHTWPVVGAALAWLAVVGLRRRLDIGTGLILALLAGQTIWLLRMQGEFMVHEYRSYWYVPAFALAAADVGVMAARWVAARTSCALVGRVAGAIVATALLAVPASRVIANAHGSRLTAGSITFPDYRPQRDLFTAARVVRAISEPDDVVLVGGGLDPRVEFWWLADRAGRVIWSPTEAHAVSKTGAGVIVVDHVAGMQEHVGWRRHVWRSRTLLIGDIIVLDMRDPTQHGTIEASRVVPGDEYGALQRFLHAPTSGEPTLERLPAARARDFARAMKSPRPVVDKAGQEHPILDSLPASLPVSLPLSAGGQIAPGSPR